MKLKTFLKSSLLALVIVTITGCGLFEKKRTFTPTESGISKAQSIEPISLEKVEWLYAKDKEKLDLILKEHGYGLFILTEEEFRNLNENMTKIVRYMKDQKSSIKYYENVIDEIDSIEEDD